MKKKYNYTACTLMFMDAFLVVFIIQFLEFIETVHQM